MTSTGERTARRGTGTARGEAVRPQGREGPRKAAITRRATEIFVRKGFAETTIEDIAGAVGVTREAIYYYFEDKAEILYAIIKPESEHLARGMARIMALEVAPRQKLVLAVEAHMARFNPNYLEMAITLRELDGRRMEARLKALRTLWKRYEGCWIDLVRSGQTAGDFRPDLDPKIAAFAILGLCNSPSSWFDPYGGTTIGALSDTFVTLVLGGLSAEGRP